MPGSFIALVSVSNSVRWESWTLNSGLSKFCVLKQAMQGNWNIVAEIVCVPWRLFLGRGRPGCPSMVGAIFGEVATIVFNVQRKNSEI
jgi:hypothetical protein